ncbi:hypothetical protein Tco_0559878 [Tanacetum coccineum]
MEPTPIVRDPYAYKWLAYHIVYSTSPAYIPGPMSRNLEERVRAADYPADRDDADEEEEEPFGDDADDEDEDEDEDEEEEEDHPASANSVPPVHRMTARISIRDEPSISLPPMEVSLLLLDHRTEQLEITHHLDRGWVMTLSQVQIRREFNCSSTRTDWSRRADYGVVLMIPEIRRQRAEEGRTMGLELFGRPKRA